MASLHENCSVGPILTRSLPLTPTHPPGATHDITLLPVSLQKLGVPRHVARRPLEASAPQEAHAYSAAPSGLHPQRLQWCCSGGVRGPTLAELRGDAFMGSNGIAVSNAQEGVGCRRTAAAQCWAQDAGEEAFHISKSPLPGQGAPACCASAGLSRAQSVERNPQATVAAFVPEGQEERLRVLADLVLGLSKELHMTRVKLSAALVLSLRFRQRLRGLQARSRSAIAKRSRRTDKEAPKMRPLQRGKLAVEESVASTAGLGR